MVTELSGGGTAAFSRECSFRGLAWVVTATSKAVHCHPMSGARGSTASSN
jgi:hypothetical protein